MLEAELARLRAVPQAVVTQAPATEPDVPKEPSRMDLNPVYGKVRDRHVGQAADPVWADVRVAVTRVLKRGGPMWVHAIRLSLPDRLKARAVQAGLPLTPAWLRLQLIRMADAWDGIDEVEGRFALAESAPPAPVKPEAPMEAAGTPPLSRRRFWALFVADVHDLLLENGPRSPNDILRMLPQNLVARTAVPRAGGKGSPVRAGKLREKLLVRIAHGRPLRELADGRFEATASWPGSRTLDAEEDV